MKILFYLTIITCFLTACQDAKNENDVIEQDSEDIEVSDVTSQQHVENMEDEVIDSSKYVFKQVFPISKTELKKNNNSKLLMQEGISAGDFVWFKNEEFNQSLAFYIYTDYFTPVTCLFYNDNIPDSLLSRMEMHTKNGFATLSEKKQNMDNFLEKAVERDKSKFITNDNIQLGCELSIFTDLYGKPQQTSKEGNTIIYGWHFDTESVDGQKMAFDTYLAYDVTAFFENDKLIGLILHDYIP